MAKTKQGADAPSNTEPAFSKEQLLQARKYAKRRDLLTALLTEDATYTALEVDNLIQNFMKGVM